MRHKTTAQRHLSGTAQPCREVVDLNGHPVPGNIEPPQDFNATQRALWFQLFDVANESDVLSSLDLVALAILTLMCADALAPGCAASDRKAALGALGMFGMRPDARGKVAPVRKCGESELEKLRARRKNTA